MSTKITAVVLFLLGTACAGARKNTQVSQQGLTPAQSSPSLFVGHSQSGEVVVAANHYQAMNGLAVEDTDLGLKARKSGSGKMLCDRELLTGTHVHKWVCRYKDELDREREQTQDDLRIPRLSFSKPSLSPAITAGRGGGARQQ